ncbi:hypothetical protein OB236_22335 [Paenibacillus sp. WQ 127069]|uniref:Uncharacterized protein n=2 Tax=Paenibacillus baimaensis TaxID=2982185 RepID=A0ABT2UJN5_9BACL|nr:hypothetical protein [Paenibacillus sp. WQ 127069]
MSLIEKVISLDERDELHVIRILILLHTLIGKKQDKTTIELTRLAKLDFLLRYPSALEKALTILNKIKEVNITEAEKNNIETNMLAFRYSPWSGDFRRLLVVLSAKCLITWQRREKYLDICLTENGNELFLKLNIITEFSSMIKQSKALKTNIASLSTLKIDNLMSEVLTELTLS